MHFVDNNSQVIYILLGMSKETRNTVVNSGDKANSGFMSILYRLFFGGDDPEREKKRLLKVLAKDLQRVRYKFYKVKGEQAQPGLAKFFFEIYKVTSNASMILQGADKSLTLKSICIEHFMSSEQLSILDGLSEEAIRERAKTMDPKALASALKEELVRLFSGFDSQKINLINETYFSIVRFLRFVNFDYYFVLKKFDSSLAERNFTASPKFDVLNGEYIVEDIKDFQEIALLMEKNDSWDLIFDILKKYKALDPVDRNDWSKMIAAVSNVNQSDVLTLIVRHAGKDPWYNPVPDKAAQRIVESYIEKTRTQVETNLNKLMNERRGAQIDKLLVMVFATKTIERTKYYTEKANLTFSKKQTNGFTFVEPINYMKAFLLDYFKKDVREFQELVLVRGKWTTNVLSQQLSELYYQILSIADQILAFDESLSEDADYGGRLRKAMGRVVERDANSASTLRKVMNEVNEKAARLVSDAAQSLITFGKYLKILLEDIDRKEHEILINWKELENMSDIPMKTRISEIYKKLYYFIQLIQLYAKANPGAGASNSVANIPDEE